MIFNIMKYRNIFIVVIVLFLMFNANKLAGSVLANVAMLQLSQTLLKSDYFRANSGQYPYWKLITADASIQAAKNNFDLSLAIFPDQEFAKWGAARCALILGKGSEAANYLTDIQFDPQKKPQLFQDAIIAFSYGGKPAEAISLYKRQNLSTVINLKLKEALTYAYFVEIQGGKLSLADAKIEIEKLLPDNMYFNYLEWASSIEAKETERTEELRLRLVTRSGFAENEFLFAFDHLAFVNLVKAGILRREKLEFFGADLAWSRQDIRGSELLMVDLIEAFPNESIWNIHLGDIYYRLGKISEAYNLYRHALAIEPQSTAAIIRLVKDDYANLKDVESIDNITQILDILFTSDQAMEKLPLLFRIYKLCSRLDQFNNGAQYCTQYRPNGQITITSDFLENKLIQLFQNSQFKVVPNTFDNGLTFQAYTVDEMTLIRGEPVDVFLYWQIDSGHECPKNDLNWFLFGDWCVQMVNNVQSEIVNGGFELGFENGYPKGYMTGIYPVDGDTSTKKIIEDDKGGLLSSVFVMDNTETFTQTSLTTRYYPIKSDGFYVQSGEFKGIAGKGWFGRNVYGNSLEYYLGQISYIMKYIRPSDWKDYRGIFVPEPDREKFQVWTLNLYTSGPLYFDNSYIFHVTFPK